MPRKSSTSSTTAANEVVEGNESYLDNFLASASTQSESPSSQPPAEILTLLTPALSVSAPCRCHRGRQRTLRFEAQP